MIRVLVVDDHKVVRQGLRFLLEQEADIEVVGECADGAEAIDAVRELVPNVVLLDLLMPGVDGIEALRKMKIISPTTQVVILTSHQGDDKVFDAIKSGAISYLLKTSGVNAVVDSVHAAARVMANSGPEEVLVSRVVSDLVAGSGFRFQDRRSYPLKAVPGEWQLFAVEG